MKNIFMIVLGILCLSCSQDDDIVNDVDNDTYTENSIMVDYNLYKNASNDEFTFKNVEIVGDSLKLIVSYGGGCGNVEFKLIDSDAILESFPVQRNIRLSFNDDDDCEALLTKTILFDLIPIQVKNEQKVILNLEGWNSSLNYEY